MVDPGAQQAHLLAVSRGPVKGITRSFLAPATSWINLLPALSPGLITAPEFPPAIAPARESNRSPPIAPMNHGNSGSGL